MSDARALLMRSAAVALCALLAVGCASRGRDALQPPPATLPSAALSPEDALLGGSSFSADDPSLNWGTGVLRPSGADGYDAIDLPLFDAPGGDHWGWVTQGRVYDLDRSQALADRSDATTPVSGTRSFLVLAREGDWMQIRYGRPDDRGGGLAWTRPDWASGRRAQYLDWADALRGARGLVFRNAAVAHNLRAGPGTQNAVIAVLEGQNFDMHALELRGDWMHVVVSTPPACVGSIAEDLLLGGAETVEQTGWIAWRSDDRGPWVASGATERCSGAA